jgi:hypothetical protein
MTERIQGHVIPYAVLSESVMRCVSYLGADNSTSEIRHSFSTRLNASHRNVLIAILLTDLIRSLLFIVSYVMVEQYCIIRGLTKSKTSRTSAEM